MVYSSLGGTDLGFNGAGQTAFKGRLTGPGVDITNDGGIWSEGSGSLALVAREGDAAPGTEPGVVFREFQNVRLNAAGQTALWGTLTGPGVDDTNDTGIWSEGSGSLSLVARAGDPAPGTEPGVVYSGSFTFPLPLNGAGQTAFHSNLTGAGVDATNDRGIWVTNLDGVPTLIAREGDLFDVNDDPFVDDLRTISGTGFASDSGGEDGRRTGFNDAGQLALGLSFTDGSAGVFIADTIATPIAGDFNGDGIVSGTDFLIWQRGESPNPLSQSDLADWEANYGTNNAPIQPGDFDGNGVVDGHDFLKWQRGESPNPLSQSDLNDWETNYGMVATLTANSAAVPEPATCISLLLDMLAMLFRRDVIVS